MSNDMTSLDEQMAEHTREARRDPRSTQELITLALTEEDEDKAWEPVTLLHFRATREVFEAARALSDSGCSRERKLAADILGQLGILERVYPDESLAILARMLEDEQDCEVLDSIVIALGHARTDGYVDPLLPLRNHPDSDIRQSVAMALGGSEDPRAIETLIEMSRDPDEDVRDWATFGLGTQTELDTPAIREALHDRISDTDKVTQGEAMVGLARRQDERVVPHLVEALDAELIQRFEPRQDLVVEAAELIADSRLLPALLRLRESWGENTILDDAICQCEGRTAEDVNHRAGLD